MSTTSNTESTTSISSDEAFYTPKRPETRRETNVETQRDTPKEIPATPDATPPATPLQMLSAVATKQPHNEKDELKGRLEEHYELIEHNLSKREELVTKEEEKLKKMKQGLEKWRKKLKRAEEIITERQEESKASITKLEGKLFQKQIELTKVTKQLENSNKRLKELNEKEELIQNRQQFLISIDKLLSKEKKLNKVRLNLIIKKEKDLLALIAQNHDMEANLHSREVNLLRTINDIEKETNKDLDLWRNENKLPKKRKLF